MKLSYVHGAGTTPLIADAIGAALNDAAERWGDRDAPWDVISSCAIRTESFATRPIAPPAR